MNCSKCGAPLADGAKFCVSCGTPVQDTPVNPTPVNPAPQAAAPKADFKKSVNDATDKVTEAVNKATKKNFKKPAVLGALAAAVALVVIVLVVIISSVVGGAYKKPIKNYVSAMKSGNAKKLASCFVTKQIIREDDDILDDYEDILVDDIQKFEVKIYDKHTVKKDVREDLVDGSVLSRLSDDDVKIKKVYKVVCHFELRKDGETRCYTREMAVGKYKGKWYILSSL